jgi:hypothetical protein
VAEAGWVLAGYRRLSGSSPQEAVIHKFPSEPGLSWRPLPRAPSPSPTTGLGACSLALLMSGLGIGQDLGLEITAKSDGVCPPCCTPPRRSCPLLLWPPAPASPGHREKPNYPCFGPSKAARDFQICYSCTAEEAQDCSGPRTQIVRDHPEEEQYPWLPQGSYAWVLSQRHPCVQGTGHLVWRMSLSVSCTGCRGPRHGILPVLARPNPV